MPPATVWAISTRPNISLNFPCHFTSDGVKLSKTFVSFVAKYLPYILLSTAALLGVATYQHFAPKPVPEGSGEKSTPSPQARQQEYSVTMEMLCAIARPGQPEWSAAAVWDALLPLSASQVASLAGDASRYRPRNEAWQLVRQAVLERWLELDPMAVLLASDGTFPLSQETLISAAAAEALQLSPDAARALLLKIPSAALRQAAIAEYVAKLTARDTQAAIAFVSGLQPGQCRSPAIKALAEALAKTDATAGFAWIEGLEPKTSRTAALDSFFRHLCESHPKAAFTAIEKFGEEVPLFPYQIMQLYRADPQAAWTLVQNQKSAYKQGFMEIIFSEEIRKDASKVTEMFAMLPIGMQRSQVLDQLAADWGKRDPTKGWAWISTLPPYDQVPALAALCKNLGQRPMAEIEKFVALLPPHLSETVADGVTLGLPLQEAKQWIDRVYTDAEAKLAVQQKYLSGQTNTWSPELMDWALSMPSEAGTLASVQQMIASALSNSKKDQVLQWVEKAPAEQLNQVLGHTIEAMTLHGGPEEALGLFTKYMNVPGVDLKSVQEVATRPMSRLAQQDPQAALTWIAKMPQEAQIPLYGAVASGWARHDATAAGTWAMQQTDPQIIQQAYESFRNHSSQGATEQKAITPALVKLAGKIPNQEDAYHTLLSHIGPLAATDPTAAEAAIQARSYTPEQVAKLRSQLPTTPKK